MYINLLMRYPEFVKFISNINKKSIRHINPLILSIGLKTKLSIIC